MPMHSTEGVSLAPSPDGRLLACTTGTSAVWVFDAATGEPVRQFEDHSQTVTGLSWIDEESVLSASMDATLKVWHTDGLGVFYHRGDHRRRGDGLRA